MAIALDVAWQSNTVTTGTTCAVTLTGVTAGALVVVTVAWFSGTNTVTVKDQANVSYTAATTKQIAGNGEACQIFYLQNVAGGNTTLTATASASSEISVSAASFTGAAKDSAVLLTTQSQAQTTVTAFTSGAATAPALSNCLAIGCTTHDATTATSSTTGSGFSTAIVATEDTNTHQSLATQWQVLSGRPTINAEFTTTAATTGATQLALFIDANIPHLIQHRSTNARATSLSLAFTNSVFAGSCILAIVCCSTGGSTMSAPTTTGLTWAGVGLQNNGGTQVQIFNVANVAGGTAYTVNATTTTGRDMELLIAEYGGVAISNPIDAFSGANANTVSLTTNIADDAIVVGISGNANTAFTAGSGFTLDEAQGTDQGDGAMEHQYPSATGAHTCNFGGGAGTVAIQAVALKPAATGGGGTVGSLLTMMGCGI